MNFWQRAWKNVSRKTTKSLLLLITFFVIGNFVIVGLGVSSAAESAKILTRKKMRAVVTYGIDYKAVDKYVDGLENDEEREDFYQHKFPQINQADVKEILQDKRIKTANALALSQVYTIPGVNDFVHLGNKREENMNGEGSKSCEVAEDGTSVCTTYQQPTLGLKANHFPDMIEFADKMYTLVEGRFYSQEDIDNKAKVVLISKALAETNNLHVGDTFSININDPNELNSDTGLKGLKEEDIRLNLEIIGIYDHNAKVTKDTRNFDWLAPADNVDNQILMPATTYQDLQYNVMVKRFKNMAKANPDDPYYGDESNLMKPEEFFGLTDVTFLLNDPLQVDSFIREYKDKVGEFKQLSANNDEFNRLSKPLDTLSLYANVIVWLVVVNAIVIITLVTALTLKTREFEIGVLLSLGASKLKIIGQFFTELALVAVLGFTLSIASGSLIAHQVGRQVLDYQISSHDIQKEDENEYYFSSVYNTDYTTDITIDDLVAEYNVSVSLPIILEIYVVGLGIVLISTLIPSLMIMRFNPKKILMSQN